MSIRFFRAISLLLAMLLFLDAGPRQIVETTIDLDGSDLRTLTATDRLEFDDLLRVLQTAVAAAEPDLDEIAALQQRLAREHANVLAYFRERETALRRAGVDRATRERMEMTAVAYRADFDTLMQYLDRIPSDPAAAASLAAFLGTRLPAASSAADELILPHRSLTPVLTETLREPVTAASTKRRAQKAVAPPDDDPPTAADLAETIEVRFTTEITQLAAALNHNPVAINNWVHNEIDFVPVWGSIQGAQACLDTRLCNAFDTSSLLIALLRASGIPARYQTGSVDVPIAEFMNWAGGFSDPAAAASLFASAGVPDVVRRLDGANNVVSVRLQHVWVRAYVDYVPSRGAVNVSGDTWIDMDASFKQHAFPVPADLSPFHNIPDADQFWNQVLNSATITNTTGEIANLDLNLIGSSFQPDEEAAFNYLATNFPGTTIAAMMGRKQVITESQAILPAGLPYARLTTGSSYDALPDSLRHKIDIMIETESGTPTLALSRSLPEIAAATIDLAYVPATTADRMTLQALFPSDENTLPPASIPAGLIDVRPVFYLDAQPVLTGTAVALGAQRRLQIGFTAPTVQTPLVTNAISAGETFAIGLDLAQISPATNDAVQARLTAVANEVNNNANPQVDLDAMQRLSLTSLILGWFQQADLINDIAAVTSEVVTLRYPSLGMSFYDLEPNTLFGAPTTLALAGIKMDIDRDIVVTLPKDGNNKAAIHHTLVTGMLGSQLEANMPRLFNSDLVPTGYWVSTSTALAEAQNLDDVMVVLTPTTLPLVQAKLGLSPSELTDIQNAINAGLEVMIHESLLTSAEDGSFQGYLQYDPQTGSGAFIIGTLGGASPVKCGADFNTKKLLQTIRNGGIYNAGTSVVTEILNQPGGRANLVGSILGLVNKLSSIAGTAHDYVDNTTLIPDNAKPLMGLAVMMAALDVLKEFLPGGPAVGAAAGAYLSMVSWTAYEGAAQIIGRMAELEAASRGVILEPGCLAKQVSTRP